METNGENLETMNVIRKIKEERQEYCRKRAVEHFNKNERFNDYVKLYQSILNE